MRWYLLFTLLLSAMLFLAVAPAAEAVKLHPPTPQPVSCNLRSTAGVETAWLTFANFSTRPVDIYWLNYEGQEVFYQHLEPSQAHLQQTYLTHPWCIRDAETGQAVLSLTMTEPAQLAIID